MEVLATAVAVFLLNMPFGYWRANVPRLSPGWLLAIHLPVPMVIGLRLLSHLPWSWETYPALVGAFFLGQLAGHGLRKPLARWLPTPLSSCLVMDLVRSSRAARARTL